MRTINIIFFSLLMIILYSCQKDSSLTGNNVSPDTSVFADDCDKNAANRGFIFKQDNKTMLYGGENEDWHFDITDWTLKSCQLNYGLGRERFDALLDPQYVKVSDNTNAYDQNERAILLLSNGPPKVYPLDLLRIHEVINEMVDGEPIMVAYCILADLAAVYSRVYCDTTFTFALSGYTYWDPEVWNGINAFVLWDRETESLWWPLIDRAVSGKMKHTWLQKHHEDKWREITWGEVLDLYPDALLLEKGQTMEPPSGWVRYDNLPCK